eukprot:CAMPEP_0172595424 /NCGR_PEP_ID=MMETSP1068-20121228/14991_1 /TAXON_ID=35684 /ORGANISM="Pseudopedinella elastica, Strain CCMP716" /LENGTH=105 /DNA_ID=CAMNT_0013393947 /DNA_START=8 /DNA_END=325 /DNA_ORIENTATION=-
MATNHGHQKEPDKFWRINGHPSNKLKEMERKYQLETKAACRAAAKEVDATYPSRLQAQRARTKERNDKTLAEALEAQKAKYEKLVEEKKAELEKQKLIVAAAAAR